MIISPPFRLSVTLLSPFGPLYNSSFQLFTGGSRCRDVWPGSIPTHSIAANRFLAMPPRWGALLL